MPTIKVNPISTISVRVNQGSPKVVYGTSTFYGATDILNEVQQINDVANSAVAIAEQASYTANSIYGLANNAVAIAEQASYTANSIYGFANNAVNIAQEAFDNANTKLNISGGEITGNLIVDQNLTVDQEIYGTIYTVDAGTF